MRFHIHTFGCRVNAAESDKLALELLNLGLESTPSKTADLVIINSCAVTAKAVREVRQLLNQVKEHQPETQVYVTGCAATLWQKQGEQISGVDMVIDNLNKEFLAKIIQRQFTLNQVTQTDPKPLGKFLASSRLMVKVQDGCDYFCTFCIVPYLRGRAKGAKPQEVLEYIQNLSQRIPINEVVLSGINLGLYKEFNQLINLLLQKTKLPKISFGSLYMENINKEFIKFYQSKFSDRLTRYLHVPLQSGSPKILSLMRRRYTLEEFSAKVAMLHKATPEALLATDIIVGFLDETAQDFADTYNYLEKSPLVKAHIFKYSQREYTAAHYLAKRLKEPTPKEKTERASALRELFSKKLKKFQQELVGKSQRALILRKLPQGYLAFLDNGLEILLPETGRLLSGFTDVRIEKVRGEKLVGRLAA